MGEGSVSRHLLWGLLLVVRQHVVSKFASWGRQLLGRAVRLLPAGSRAIYGLMLRRQLLFQAGNC